MGKRGPRGRNFLPIERQLIYKMVREMWELDEINLALERLQVATHLTPRKLPLKSYQMLHESYLPHLQDDKELEEQSLRPRPIGKLRTGGV